MRVGKNMLTRDSNKGTYMKSFFVVLISVTLVGCGSRGNIVVTIEDPEPVSVSQETSPAVLDEPDVAAQNTTVDAVENPEPAPDSANVSPAVLAEPDAADQDAAVDATKAPEPVANAPGTLPTAQADAVAAIRKIGGSVRLDAKSGEAISASLSSTEITDAGLQHVEHLTSLVILDLAGTQITDEGLVHLRGMTGLTTLNVASTQITDEGLKHLTGLTSLTGLDVTSTQMTDSGRAAIEAALPKCTVTGP